MKIEETRNPPPITCLPLVTICALTGLSESTIRTRGFQVAAKHNKQNLYDARAVLTDFLRREKEKAKTGAAFTKMEAADIRKANAQAEKAEIQAKIFRRDFVSAEKVAEVWQDVTTIFRQTLLNANKKLLAKISRAKDDKTRAKILRAWAEEALEETKINADRYLSSFEVDDADAEAEENNDRQRLGDKELLPDDE